MLGAVYFPVPLNDAISEFKPLFVATKDVDPSLSEWITQSFSLSLSLPFILHEILVTFQITP